jgi:choline dehydrogenase-like flavoprotein
MSSSHYDVIVGGSGFASAFFLHELLQGRPGKLRVLVLERGEHHTHQWQRENQSNSRIQTATTFVKQGLTTKDWYFTIGFGGSSNCWTACTPRMLPNDFRLRTAYGVGEDWPLSYDDIEPLYAEVEQIMGVSGPPDWTLSPRSTPFPQPPHRLSKPDEMLRSAYPGLYYPQATARARVPTANRPACCASAHCYICPIDAKFTVLNEMKQVWSDKRLEVRTGCEIERLELGVDTASAVHYRHEGKSHRATADLFALGTNAIFNAAILKRSGDTHPLVGKRLHEQVATEVAFDLKGVENFQGSTFIPGQGYMFYDGDHRREYGGCMTENLNMLTLVRTEFGRWRERMAMVFIVEDLPLEENRVDIDAAGNPLVIFNRYSEYGLRGLAQVRNYAEEISRHLPVERVTYADEFRHDNVPRPTEAHIQGTVVMGADTASSVVDPWLAHHRYRNVLVLGSSAFPTGAPANPTLTLSALSIRAARKLL